MVAADMDTLATEERTTPPVVPLQAMGRVLALQVMHLRPPNKLATLNGPTMLM